MNRLVIKKPSWIQAISLVQLLLLFFYLGLNIINIGESGGAALPLLVAFSLISVGVLFIQAMSKTIVIHFSLFFFLLFIVWIALKVVIDLSDIQYLKQITIATTGGILLFFFIGIFSKQALDVISKVKVSLFSVKVVLLIFLTISFSIFSSFQSRLLERTDIFYIEGVEGGYQRPGNFLIIIFIIVSFALLSIASHKSTKMKFSLFLWLMVYSLGFIAALVSSQMFGSNTATANLVAIYLITVVLSLFSFNKKVRLAFLSDKIGSLFSKGLIIKLIKYSFVSIITIFVIALIGIQVTGFDVNKTRVFGFGSGDISSIGSRSSIFKETGLDQLSYAPILGDMNVARIITGDAGSYLHNFLPNVMSELGLFGLLIVIILFLLVFLNLIKNVKNNSKNDIGFQRFVTNVWLLFVLLFLFIYANFAVEKSWVVLWFYIGFAVNMISTNDRVNEKINYLNLKKETQIE